MEGVGWIKNKPKRPRKEGRGGAHIVGELLLRAEGAGVLLGRAAEDGHGVAGRVALEGEAHPRAHLPSPPRRRSDGAFPVRSAPRHSLIGKAFSAEWTAPARGQSIAVSPPWAWPLARAERIGMRRHMEADRSLLSFQDSKGK